MKSLPYEIAADCAGLAGVLLEYPYWHARANWGLTERDLLNGTLACAGLGIVALASATHPDARAPSSMAVLFITTPLERVVNWIFRQKRTFYMARIITLGLAILYVGFTLATSTPNIFGQARHSGSMQVDDNSRELATHAEQIKSLDQWRRDMEAMNMPGRMMVMERNVSEMKDDQKYLARLLYGSLLTGLIYLIQQFLALVRKGST